MATNNSNSGIYGLLAPGNKGKLSLQTLGSAALGDEDVDESGLPTSPFTNLPLQMGGAPSPAQIAQIQAANIPQGFQFTGAFDARNRGLLQQESDAGLNRTNSLAAIAEQFLQATRQAEQSNAKGRKSLFASLADRGALGSGAALQSVADYDTEFNDYLNNLSRARAADSANAENSYASILNQLGRQREGLVSEQQQYEEQRRLEEERVRAEAERQRVAEEQRREQINQMIAAQQAAQQAAQAAAAAAAARPSYSMPSFGGGGGGGGASYGSAPQAPQPQQGLIQLPQFGPGVSRQAVESWIVNNIDRNLAGNAGALNGIIREFQQNGGVTSLDRISQIIASYAQPTQQYSAGGGMRRY